MNEGKSLPTIAATCLAMILTGSLPALGGDRSVVEFKEGEDLNWRVVDDGVMGGLSKGKIEVSNDGILRFWGTLSLENNGGFSSLRTGNVSVDLGGFDGLTARVKGDGRTYQMRLATDVRYRGMEVSFGAEFPTKKGEWTEVKVPFDKFKGSFRGMKLNDAKFDPSKIQRVGLILADKNPGPFELKVDWIRSYKSGPGTGTIVDAALADGRFKTLAAALTEADLVGALQGDGPFTVFAPTDDAFAKLPKGTVEDLLKKENREQLQAILKYHVASGKVDLAGALKAGQATTLQGEALNIKFTDGRVRVGEASIVNADIVTSNGVIHVIDSVLLPPAPVQKNDILGVASAAGNFKTLLAAVEAAGLTPVLESEGPFTIFAPTDKAFAALPEGTVSTLLQKENLDKLKAILTYHAIPGSISAGDALNAKAAKTANGEKVSFKIENGTFKVNGATILTTDIKCDNGVIHVIDAVLLPECDESKEECEEPSTQMTATERIEDAISRGVPIFNKGDHGACADIYKECLKELANDEQIDSVMREAMKRLLEKTSDHGSETDRAWIYRKSLDHVHGLLSTSRT